ncbi:triose-phosphate isomerase [Luteimonas sp. MC1750]|uniref:triose-phosphate isomerase n=1 Tax=Luteimonas sp. MC1750 TaxID=2799326 RepID=UPI0018F0B869|nr:triose-phosphate isomerase [Luteimonas sp. MC1750]MBJ6984472.1 triose-phosphate isomerase [Luteimonas sp. MC1750]QQO04915.1 triose-phosphate isomerase [Luteimonas sp. MC1750]
MRTRIVAGNWKLNGNRSSAADLLQQMAAGLPADGVEVVVLPPATLLAGLVEAWGARGIAFGGQDVSEHGEGAYTGEVSAAMLADAGARFALVGHSERRQYHREDSDLVARKFAAALAAGLRPILCVGESKDEREGGTTEAVIASQLRPVLDLVGAEGLASAVVAYEPVWAIGTGLTASPQQAQDVHAFIRSEVAARSAKIGNSLPILYGGSVKPANAAELFTQPDVDGGLIGGASLVATDFMAIVAAAVR